MADLNNKVSVIRFTALTLRKNLDNDDSARLAWSTRAAYPRITVFTSEKNRMVDGRMNYSTIITAPFDYVTLSMFMENMNTVIKSKEAMELSLDCFNVKYENGVKTSDIYKQAEVKVGKDEEGIVYISAVEDGKKDIKFLLLPNARWYKFKDKTGAVITNPGTLSTMYARSYLKTLNSCFMQDIVRATGLDSTFSKNNGTTSVADIDNDVF